MADGEDAATPSRADLGRPLADELRRQQLIDLLAERWQSRVVLMHAPGGYGKSTALAQAIRDNDSDPTGLDVHVRVVVAPDALRNIADEILDGLGAPPVVDVTSDPVVLARTVSNAVAAASPVDVCLCLDDLHHSDAIPGLTEFVAALLDRLPYTGHLLLSGRTLPDLRTARLRANDDVVEVTTAELAFDDAELALLAAHHDVPADVLHSANGWPAVTRLRIVAGKETSVAFMIEEVIEGLSTADRTAITVAVIAGVATPALLDEVAARVDVADLLRRVPLLVDRGDGSFGAHDLWGEAIDDVMTIDERATVAARIIAHLGAAGDHQAAVGTALRHQLWDDALAHMMSVFIDLDLNVGLEQLDRWIEALPPDVDGDPVVCFLTGVRARLAGEFAASTPLVLEAAQAFEAIGDLESETTAIIELGLQGWLLHDADLWRHVAIAGHRIIAAGGERMRRWIVMGRVVESDLRGDFAQSLAEYRTLPERDELALGHCSTLSLLVGDDQGALEFLSELRRRFPGPGVEWRWMVAQWDAGRPAELLALPNSHKLRLDNSRDDVRIVFVESMIEANCGVVPDPTRLTEIAWDRRRERAYVALVWAAHDVLTTDDATAAAAFERRLDEIGFDEPLLRGELRRYLPYAYVLSPRCRVWLDSDEQLGPLQRRLLAVARQVVALRSGRPVDAADLPSDDALLTWLPLSWSVELAARLATQGHPRGLELATSLSLVAGKSVHDTLRRTRVGHPELGTGVDALLAGVAAPPEQAASVTVCARFEIRHGDTVAEVSRRRVRQLVTLLTLRDRWARESLAAVMWPGDPVKARVNLRATLSHVRQALEPGRRPGEADYQLLQQGDSIWLRRSQDLQVDVWTIEESRAEAARAEARQDIDEVIRLRLDAFGRWSPDAFADVSDLDAVADEIEHIRRSVLDGACWVAERLLARGAPAEATTVATQVLEHDADLERAHGVIIGAALAVGDLGAAERAVDRTRRSLHDLDVRPSPGIDMLIRRYERRLVHRSSTQLSAVDAG